MPMRIVSGAAPGTDASPSVVATKTSDASGRGLIMTPCLSPCYPAPIRCDPAWALLIAVEPGCSFPSARSSAAPTFGERGSTVNVQDCGIYVRDCAVLWHAWWARSPDAHRSASHWMCAPAGESSSPKGAQKSVREAPGSPSSGPVVQPDPAPSLPDASPRDRNVVLVVDDDAGIREAFHVLLDEDYAVMEAAHGRTALGIVLGQRVDLVLLDILLPDVDGLEILQELKAREPDLPVIMVTAVKTVRTTAAAMNLGSPYYVTKPFHDEELLATIRRALEQRTSKSRVFMDRDLADRGAQQPRTHRLLLVGGDPGWRAALAVTLARATSVETTATLVEGLNRMLGFRPTCVVLNVSRSTGEAARFLGVLNAQLPACPVLVISHDAYLGATSVWEALNIRSVLRPPVSSGDLVRRIGAALPPGDSLSGPWPQPGDAVSRTIDYLSRHFGEDLTVNGIAETMEISPSHLAHLFRSETGMSVKDYLTRVRVTIAQDLLARTDEKLEAVAARVGFVDTSHLAHDFQRITGRPPSAYRRG